MALHHLHVRKRIFQKKEPYPSKKKWVHRLDNLMLGVGILGPIATIPQAMQVWATRSAAGLNLYTWVIFVILACFWLLYGIVHREKPLIITYFFFVIVQAVVVLGILVYG